MKKVHGLLLLGAFSLLATAGLLHGCGSKEESAAAPATPSTPSTPSTPATPAVAKFTIVGSGN